MIEYFACPCKRIAVAHTILTIHAHNKPGELVKGTGSTIGHISLLRGYPPCCAVHHEHWNRPTVKKRLDPELGPVKAEWAVPTELSRQLGEYEHSEDPKQKSTGHRTKRSKNNKRIFKKAVAHQSMHPDGRESDAGVVPSFCPMLMALNDDATLRVWECSHDLQEYAYDAVNDDTRLKNADEDAVAAHLRRVAPEGSMLATGGILHPKTIVIPRAWYAVFLPSLLHAGSCISDYATRINYRLHVYARIRGKRGFKHGAAHAPHKIATWCCAKWQGGDYDL